MHRILVTFATRYGSTAEIAAAIASELASQEFLVDVLAAGPQIETAKYDAVIVGAPSYGRKWLPEASVFVVANRDTLANRPVAYFTVGTLGVKNPKSALREHSWIMTSLRDLAPTVEPVSNALFHGSFSRKNLPLVLRFCDWLAGTPQGDHRDWGAIESWARKVGEEFSQRLDEHVQEDESGGSRR